MGVEDVGDAGTSDDDASLAVARQQRQADSTLNRARQFLSWRRQQPALVRGSIRFLDLPAPLLGFVRETESQSLWLIFNLSDERHLLPLPGTDLQPMDGHGMVSGITQTGQIELPPRAVWIAEQVEAAVANAPLIHEAIQAG